jgi:hypothetical protein
VNFLQNLPPLSVFSGSGGLGYTYERTAEKDSKYLYKNLEQ